MRQTRQRPDPVGFESIDAIAERTLMLRMPGDESLEAIISIGRPMPMDVDWACEVHIDVEGRGTWLSQRIYSVDSAQALVLALGVIPDFVIALERETGATVHWLDAPGSGFPGHPPLT